VKKVLATLDEMKRDHHAQYLEFWAAFGAVMKEGLLGDQDRDKILDLVLTGTTDRSAPLTSLEGYVGRMKEGQDTIYYLTGPAETIAKSPLLETFVDKGYEVLLFSDPVDEIWLEQVQPYKAKKLVSIGRGDVALGTEEERKQATESLEQKQRELGDLLVSLRVALQDRVKEVRLSTRLTSSPACIVSDAADLSPRMQRMMEQLGHAPPPAKPVLELNPGHAVVEKLHAIFAESPSDPRLALYAELLFGQAHLADSGTVPDPAALGRAIADLMVRG
ncbi:MAG: molecular chaperone HtpG, partial [Kofleriaceae bacterium]